MGMPVSELTQRMSSDELASWAAYEEAVGPVGTERIEAILARMSEQLHEGTWWFLQKNFQGSDPDEGIVHLNPYGEQPGDRGRMPRPGQDWKFGYEHIAARKLTALEASLINYEDDEDDPEDGEAE